MYKFYTREYEGETVSDSLHWRDGNKDSNGVWMPKTIINEGHTGVAHVIGNGPSRLKHKLQLLHGQVGGEGGVHSVGQSYGCNQLFQDFNPTFLFCVNPEILQWIVDSNYYEDNIVYTTRKNLIKFPGKFHLYPHYEPLFMGPAALRLACADGHKKIFMIGCDFYMPNTQSHIYPATDHSYLEIDDTAKLREKLIRQFITIMEMYEDVEFYYVIPEQVNNPGHLIDAFNWLDNVKCIGSLQYINMAELGATYRTK